MAQLVGNIEFVSAQTIRGWAAEKNQKSFNKTKISVALDGKTLCDIDKFHYRHDVKEAGFGDGEFGFEADISKYSVTDQGKILTIGNLAGNKIPYGDDGPEIETLKLRHTLNNNQPAFYSLDLGQNLISDTDVKDAKKVAILVTFVKSGKLFDHHFKQVASLKQAGYFVIVVHVSAEQNTAFEMARSGDVILRKENLGYDFGSWWYGAQWLEKNFPRYYEKLNSLILLNDSCFGHVNAKNIAMIEAKNADIAGISDSFDRTYHIQSFFLMIKSDFLHSGEFGRWLSAYPFPAQKQDVILAGEIGLGVLADDLSLRISALAPYNQMLEKWYKNLKTKIADEITCYQKLGFNSSYMHDKIEAGFYDFFDRFQRGVNVNPTHIFWQEILEQNIPLVKRELLLLNPANIPNPLSLARKVMGKKVIGKAEFNHFMQHETSKTSQVARNLPLLLQD